MKRSNLRRECQRPHRVFLGSVFLICLHLVSAITMMNTTFFSEYASFVAVQFACAQDDASLIKEKDELYGGCGVFSSEEVEKTLSEEDLNDCKAELIYSTRNFRPAFRFKSPFAEYEENKEVVKDELDTSIQTANREKGNKVKENTLKENVTNNNSEEKAAEISLNNKNGEIEIKGVIWGEKPQAIFFYNGQVVLAGIGEYCGGKHIVDITKDEIIADEGVIWKKV